jgi:hypothetical protein
MHALAASVIVCCLFLDTCVGFMALQKVEVKVAITF